MNITRHAVLAVVAAMGLSVSAHAQCLGDINVDGSVGFNDLVTLLAEWGPCAGACPSDLNGDDEVGFADLLALLAAWGPCDSVFELDLVGVQLGGSPYFTPMRAIPEFEQAFVAIDPADYPATVGAGAILWIVEARTAAEWDANPTLVDVRGGPQGIILAGPGLQGSTIGATGFIPGDAGASFGRAYDVVVDLNLNGILDAGDFIDGRGDEAGFYVVSDPVAAGPYAVSSATYSGGSFLGQRTYWPSNIASLGQLPLVVISHGNGHQYTWYDYLGNHLASYGYVVMSHQNNTMPGPDAASITTLSNTDYLLGNLGTIAGGVLDGHVDSSRIVWIGHSRGGEGVARAYDRIRDGTSTPTNYGLSDIKLISSIAPTDFLGPGSANPHEANYHLMYGSADGDVSGAPDCGVCQSFRLLERATGFRTSHYVQGADHNDFNCCGFNDFNGPSPTEIGRPETQRVAKGAYLALLKYVIDGEPAAQEYLWRQYEALRPQSVSVATVVDLEFKADSAASAAIDDFQTQTSTSTSSSGGAVNFTVSNLTEGRLDDGNNSFTWQTNDPFNGMTRGGTADTTRGAVFDWNADAFLRFSVVPALADFSAYEFLSLRACQGTRHPNTIVTTGDLSFTVTLEDGDGVTSSIRIASYRGGVENLYPRTGSGTGTGWQNEFETIRMRTIDFRADGTGLDLTNIVSVTLEFGPSFGTSPGRLGIDDIELTNE